MAQTSPAPGRGQSPARPKFAANFAFERDVPLTQPEDRAILPDRV
jgi:hypothetical protein